MSNETLTPLIPRLDSLVRELSSGCRRDFANTDTLLDLIKESKLTPVTELAFLNILVSLMRENNLRGIRCSELFEHVGLMHFAAADIPDGPAH